MALKPIMDGKKIIGYEEVPDEPEWKEWKGGDYDDSDGEFVPGTSHVLMRKRDGKVERVGRAAGKGWTHFTHYRRAQPGDEKLPTT